MLNAILTVEQGKPAAHAGRGWGIFTDAIIEQLLKRPHPTVCMLWGAYAQKKFYNLHSHINPSPFSAHRFLGYRHFSKANEF